jgi:hypothetical protein
MDGLRDHHVKWSQPGSKGQILCVFPHMQKLGLQHKDMHKYIYDFIDMYINRWSYMHIYIHISSNTHIYIERTGLE